MASTYQFVDRNMLTAEESSKIFATLPREADALTDRIIEVLTESSFLADDPEIRRKARNVLTNDPKLQKLVRR